MEEVNLKTSPRKEITNVEADIDGFDDSLGKLQVFIKMMLTALLTPTSFPQARNAKQFSLNPLLIQLMQKKASVFSSIILISLSLHFRWVHLKQNLLWKKILK